MSLTVMKLMLVLGIIGHALNMYCDRILSVFSEWNLENWKILSRLEKMTKQKHYTSIRCSF